MIEIYNDHHFNGNKLKRGIQLKRLLLKNSGYSVLDIDGRKLDSNWKDEIKNKLQR